MLFGNKLQALNYHNSFDIEDVKSFRELIYWLENDKIRYYPPDDRDYLLPDADNWDQSFQKYLDSISYPLDVNNKKITLDWLLTIALRYDIEDTRRQQNLSRESVANLAREDSTQPADAFNTFDINSPAFLNELRELCKTLNIPFYDDEPLVVLRAVSILLNKTKNSSQASSSPSTHTDAAKRSKMSTQLDESILTQPFSKKKASQYTPALNRAANVLRLLYIKDLRNLQTQVNSMMVEVQALTANPKTDTSLGKVGF